MASSLRSRLWLSYALLIVILLAIVAVGLVVALQRNPILYRQTVTRLYLAGSAVAFRLVELPRVSTERVDKILQREAEVRKLRLAVLGADGAVLLEYGAQRGSAKLPNCRGKLRKMTPTWRRSFVMGRTSIGSIPSTAWIISVSYSPPPRCRFCARARFFEMRYWGRLCRRPWQRCCWPWY